MQINETRYRVRLILILLTVALVFGTYIFLLLQVQQNYKPVWSDEFFYYINAHSFFENNSLKAALTVTGKGSKLFGADAHGFSYPLLNGLIAKGIGWHQLNFIYSNFFFLGISILLVCLQKSISIWHKFMMVFLILTFPCFSLYAFTYMQEAIHMLFAISIGLLLYHISQKDNKAVYVVAYLFVVFFAGLFRAVWFFSWIGLLPFIGGRNKFLVSVFLLAGILISTFVITWLFVEPIPTFYNELVAGISQGEIWKIVKSLFGKFATNAKMYFYSASTPAIYLVMKYSIVLALGYFVYKAALFKTKIYVALSLIGITNFLFLFLLFDSFYWRDIRLLAPLIYLFIPCLVCMANDKIKYIVPGVSFLLFITAYPLVKERIEERNISSGAEMLIKKTDYALLKNLPKGNPTILLNYIPADHTTDLICLPLQNIEGNQINYIVPYCGKKNINFDFIFERSDTILPYFKVIKGNYFTLYSK